MKNYIIIILALVISSCGSSSNDSTPDLKLTGSSQYSATSTVIASEFPEDLGVESTFIIAVSSVTDNKLDLTLGSENISVEIDNKKTFKFSLIENEDGGVTTSIITIEFDSDDLKTFTGSNSWTFVIDGQSFSGISSIVGNHSSGDLAIINK